MAQPGELQLRIDDLEKKVKYLLKVVDTHFKKHEEVAKALKEFSDED